MVAIKFGSVVTVKVGESKKVGIIENNDDGISTIRLFGERTDEHYTITVPDAEIIEVIQE